MQTRIARLPDGPPLIQVVVDTEEEFDWSRPFERTCVSVRAVEAQPLGQRLFDAFGIKPTYVIDYPVAVTPSSVAILKDFLQSGRCQIGAHLHPWVNPPFTETVSAFNSFPGNLDPPLEHQKLELLTSAITTAFGIVPVIYKAGRYGIGPGTQATLSKLGYLIDLSVVPHTDFTMHGGPNFLDWPGCPCWFGDRLQLFEIPLSRGFVGIGARAGRVLYPAVETKVGRLLHVGGIWSRTCFLERVGLTPEGTDVRSLLRLMRVLLNRGHRVLTLTYHSPSLAPGNTPYVRNELELQQFLDKLKYVLDEFFEVHGGRPTTPLELLNIALVADGKDSIDLRLGPAFAPQRICPKSGDTNPNDGAMAKRR